MAHASSIGALPTSVRVHMEQERHDLPACACSVQRRACRLGAGAIWFNEARALVRCRDCQGTMMPRGTACHPSTCTPNAIVFAEEGRGECSWCTPHFVPWRLYTIGGVPMVRRVRHAAFTHRSEWKIKLRFF